MAIVDEELMKKGKNKVQCKVNFEEYEMFFDEKTHKNMYEFVFKIGTRIE